MEPTSRRVTYFNEKAINQKASNASFQFPANPTVSVWTGGAHDARRNCGVELGIIEPLLIIISNFQLVRDTMLTFSFLQGADGGFENEPNRRSMMYDSVYQRFFHLKVFPQRIPFNPSDSWFIVNS